MKPRILVFALLLLGCTSVRSQQTDQETLIPVVDFSAANSPLEIEGDVRTFDKPAEQARFMIVGRLSVTNISSKPILLTVLKLKGINVVGVNDTSIRDYYFSEPFEPQKSENQEWTYGPFLQRAQLKTEEGPKWVDVEPIKAVRQEVIASVLFVQYADGTGWGDREAAKDALAAREETRNRLTALASIYRDEGEKAFVDSLMQPSNLNAVIMLQFICKKTDDKSKVVDRFFRILSKSDEHERLMNAK
jgi:mannitol/fructose-specific phosphotransferase system IIA component